MSFLPTIEDAASAEEVIAIASNNDSFVLFAKGLVDKADGLMRAEDLEKVKNKFEEHFNVPSITYAERETQNAMEVFDYLFQSDRQTLEIEQGALKRLIFNLIR